MSEAKLARREARLDRATERQAGLEKAADRTGSLAIATTAEVHGHIVDLTEKRAQDARLELGAGRAFDRANAAKPTGDTNDVSIKLL